MNKIEVYTGRIIEMAALYNAHQDNSMGRAHTPSKKMDVIFIPVIHNGTTRWTVDLIEDEKLAGFREAAFCEGMEDTYPEEPEEALVWLKEFFDLDFNDVFISGPSHMHEPIPDGYTKDDILRLVAPVVLNVPAPEPRLCTTFSRSY